MIQLIICDDDHFTREWLNDFLMEAVRKTKKNARVICQAASARELLLFIRNNPGEYLFFLDLDLGQERLGGLDLARVLRREFPLSKMVFVTSHVERSMDILKSGVEPFGFIEKDINRKAMVKEFADILMKISDDSRDDNEKDTEERLREIELPIGIEETVKLPVRDIAYVEALKNKPHYICYHTLDGSQITVRDTMSHALSLLGKGFAESHRSVIVNQKSVIECTGTQLKLSNGEYVACALGKRKLFEGEKNDV